MCMCMLYVVCCMYYYYYYYYYYPNRRWLCLYRSLGVYYNHPPSEWYQPLCPSCSVFAFALEHAFSETVTTNMSQQPMLFLDIGAERDRLS